MNVDINFQVLRKVFTPKRIKRILSIYNNLNPDKQVDINTIWQRNYYTLSKLLNRNGYKGDLTDDHIISFFHEKATQVNKQLDNELFNKLNEQRLQQKKQEYMNTIKERAISDRQSRS